MGNMGILPKSQMCLFSDDNPTFSFSEYTSLSWKTEKIFSVKFSTAQALCFERPYQRFYILKASLILTSYSKF